ncbi:MAG: ABC transporter transmembrane domain-containing protein [Lautropia sp.]
MAPAAVREQGQRDARLRERSPVPAGDLSDASAAGSRKGLLRLIPFLAPYRGRLVLASGFLLLAAAASLAIPVTLRELIDSGLAASDADRLLIVRDHFLALLGVAIALATFTSLRFYLVSWIGERITTDLRQAVYTNVLAQRPAFFETLQTGEVLSRLTGDTTLVQTVIGSSASMGLRSLITVIGGVAMLASIRPALVLTVGLVLLGFVLPLVLIGRRVRRLSRASQDRLADASAVAAEVINAIPVVQSFGQEAREAARFAAATERGFETAIRRTRVRALMTALAIAAVFGANLYGLYVGVQAVLAGQLSAGTLGQIALLIGMIASSAAVLAEVWGDLLRAAGAVERLVELLAAHDADGAPTDPHAARQPSEPSTAARRPAVPRIVFESVSFAYPSRPEQRVLSDIDLVIEPGSTVALVGASGAGKTTLFQLLQRFHEIDRGRILIDSRDTATMPLDELRRSIAIVPQDPVVFSGTAAYNIRYARPNASDDAVRDAARRAFADEFLTRLPDGYETFLGERGVRLSGGQRQRIAIARAILADRPILLLDEATSALDAQSERMVQQALDAARRDRTTLVIAHRLATVQSADAIVVMEAGRIVASGTHASLLEAGGLYATLARMQFSAAPVAAG